MIKFFIKTPDDVLKDNNLEMSDGYVKELRDNDMVILLALLYNDKGEPKKECSCAVKKIDLYNVDTLLEFINNSLKVLFKAIDYKIKS